MKLEKANNSPLYYQLADKLRAMVQNNAIKQGDPFPSEPELMKRYNVSRGTVREALRLLSREGLIDRQQGIGTFVNSSKFEHGTADVIGFSRVMQIYGKVASAKILQVEKIFPPKTVRDRLLLGPFEKTILIKRLRLGDKIPMLIEHSYYRMEIGEILMSEDLTGSIYQLLTEKYNYQLLKSENTIEATVSDEETATLLNISPGSAVLILNRLVYYDENQPFEYAEDIYRADQVKFTIYTNKKFERIHD